MVQRDGSWNLAWNPSKLGRSATPLQGLLSNKRLNCQKRSRYYCDAHNRYMEKLKADDTDARIDDTDDNDRVYFVKKLNSLNFN